MISGIGNVKWTERMVGAEESNSLRSSLLDVLEASYLGMVLENGWRRKREELPGWDLEWAIMGCSENPDKWKQGAEALAWAEVKLQQEQVVVGYVGYDFRPTQVKSESKAKNWTPSWPEALVFVPDWIVVFDAGVLRTWGQVPEIDYKDSIGVSMPKVSAGLKLEWVEQKDDYIKKVECIRGQIEEGEYYEINYCNALVAEGIEVSDGRQWYETMQAKMPQPMSGYVKWGANRMWCASMERYLKKEGRQLMSQPIKGTSRLKGNETAEEVTQLKLDLQNDEKERAENVMIVDLVRHDLAGVCTVGSVQVPELFNVLAYPTLLQMMSTVTGTLLDGKTWKDALERCFPMGSMTGAPKKAVMEELHDIETLHRGPYSGCLGWVDAAGDMDWNVVIRTLIYDSESNRLIIPIGSAITYDSKAELEWEECETKAAGWRRILEGE